MTDQCFNDPLPDDFKWLETWFHKERIVLYINLVNDRLTICRVDQHSD